MVHRNQLLKDLKNAIGNRTVRIGFNEKERKMKMKKKKEEDERERVRLAPVGSKFE